MDTAYLLLAGAAAGFAVVSTYGLVSNKPPSDNVETLAMLVGAIVLAFANNVSRLFRRHQENN